jgi:hypothetical protein
MRSYHRDNHFTKHAVALFERACELVQLMPDPPEGAEPWRCHEVARAVGDVLKLRVVDGYCGAVEHSWLVIPNGAARGVDAILDVYAAGILPQVLLVDCEGILPYRDVYRPSCARADVRHDAIGTLLGFTSEAGVSS